MKDNRFGFRFGGPIWPWNDKAFFFLNYEGRRFPRTTSILRIVPTDSFGKASCGFAIPPAQPSATSGACGGLRNRHRCRTRQRRLRSASSSG